MDGPSVGGRFPNRRRSSGLPFRRAAITSRTSSWAWSPPDPSERVQHLPSAEFDRTHRAARSRARHEPLQLLWAGGRDHSLSNFQGYVPTRLVGTALESAEVEEDFELRNEPDGPRLAEETDDT